MNNDENWDDNSPSLIDLYDCMYKNHDYGFFS